MDETVVASAVLLPEPSDLAPAPSTLKRRQSSLDSDSSKRPRLNPQDITDPRFPPTASEDRRRSSARGTGAFEERKRGQRLFGAILGTLSQSNAKTPGNSSTSVAKRRAEIERKQKEKLRANDVEDEERKREKREELDRVRRVEQKGWDEESMRIRHRNTLSMASFLKTRTEPTLYYKPWELRSEEEDRIQQQISETQETIDREVREVEEQRGMEKELERTNAVHEIAKAGTEPLGESDAHPHDMDMDARMDDPSEDPIHDIKAGTNGTDSTKADQRPTNGTATTLTDEDKTMDNVPGGTSAADDHGGEELVEGQEDDVIY